MCYCINVPRLWAPSIRGWETTDHVLISFLNPSLLVPQHWIPTSLRVTGDVLLCAKHGHHRVLTQRGWHPLECTKDKANVTEIKTSTILGRWVPLSADISQVNAAAYTEQVQTAISVNVSPWNASSILEIAVDLGDLCATSVSPVWGGIDSTS